MRKRNGKELRPRQRQEPFEEIIGEEKYANFSYNVCKEKFKPEIYPYRQERRSLECRLILTDKKGEA